jgi:hypothetical protein
MGEGGPQIVEEPAARRDGRRRLAFGELVAAVSGFALFVVLFFDWYDAVAADGGHFGVSAWEALSVIDVVLAVLAAAPLIEAALRAWARVPDDLPVPRGAIVAAAGLLALGLAIFRLAALPHGVEGRRIGPFLAIVAATGIVLGAVTAIGERGEARARRPPQA